LFIIAKGLSGRGLPSYDRAMDGSYEGNAGAIAQATKTFIGQGLPSYEATPWPINVSSPKGLSGRGLHSYDL